MVALIPIIFQSIVLPEIGRWLASRGTNQPMPTEVEILAQMNQLADNIINASVAFLKSKGAA